MSAGPGRGSMPSRAGVALIAVGCLAFGLPRWVAAADPAALCGHGPLEILLTNDDGYQAAGIRALRRALLGAGHHVTLAAPDYNASGSAMSFNWGPVRVTRDPQEASVFGIAGTPATSVVLAATALYPAHHRPDLVISGINHGSNTGSLLVISGTVGAALAGTLLLDPPVPGIAVNALRLHGAEAADSASNRAQFEAVSGHFARLLDSLRGWYCKAGTVTRPRSVLNVNYPARAISDVRGVVVARQGSATDLRIVFGKNPDEQYQAQVSARAPDDARDSDNRRLEDGYVTVTPLNGRIGDEGSQRGLERRLRGL
jgi:5'-nucleotidase